MKKYRMILLAAIAVIFSGCVKDLEKEGFQAETELMGTVVEKSTNNPLPDIKVSITDGDHIHASTTTNQRGDFKLKVNYDELNNDYYLLLDGSPTMPFKQEELHGMGGKVYDYKTIVLYDKTNADLLPQVITGEISNVGFNTATVAGRVSSDGGHKMVVRGVCYATHQTPTLDDMCKTAGADTGSYHCNLDSLQPCTTYYVRTYATNSIGVSYGLQKTFTTTDGRPTLSTTTVTDITATTAKSGGNVTDNGGYNVTARGICWNTMGSPDLNDQHTSNGSGNGTFTSNMTGLVAGATYHVRAYATNSCGTSYGNELVFSTSNGSVKMTIAAATNITATSASCSVTISNDGGAAITKRGICWSTSQYPTTASSNVAVGSGTGAFNASMSNLSPNTTYYVRAYAVNAAGTSYSNQISFCTSNGSVTMTIAAATNITATSASCSVTISNDGGAAITKRGICWSTSQYPTTASSNVAAGSGTGAFNASMSNLSPNTTYYVRAFAVNAAGTSYSNQISFATKDGLPTVTTGSVSNVTANSAACSGNVSSDGGFAVTAKGLCWSMSQYPVVGNGNYWNDYGSGTGSFNASMTNLKANTTYYVRAYATNSNGTVYGDQKNFNTSNGTATVTLGTVNNITALSAASSVTVSNVGGATLQSCGICWSTTQNPTIGNNKVEGGKQLNTTYPCNMSNLTPNTTYYVRAYATTNVTTSYSSQVSFKTTTGLPVLTTANTTASSVSISSGGNITSDGGYAITARGVCYSTTNSNPTVSDSCTTAGTGTGSFSSTIKKVSVNTTYYVRAYATNSIGTAYGNVVNVKTGNGLPTVTTTTPSLNGTTASTGGNVTNDGGYAVTARGVCYGSLPYPDLTANYKHTTDGSGTGYFASSFTLPKGSGMYYVRAYATNANGTTYGTQMTVVHPYDTLPTFQYGGHTYKVAPDPGVDMNYSSAKSYCDNLTLYGYSDWIMPDKAMMLQMCSMKNSIGGFMNSNYYYYLYWTSTYGATNNNNITSNYYVRIADCGVPTYGLGSGVDVNSTASFQGQFGGGYMYLHWRVRPIRMEK